MFTWFKVKAIVWRPVLSQPGQVSLYFQNATGFSAPHALLRIPNQNKVIVTRRPKEQTIYVQIVEIDVNQELMSWSMQLLYYAYVTASLVTDLLLAYIFFCERKLVPVQWRQLITCNWSWQSHGSLILEKLDLKMNRSTKTPCQEYSGVACSSSSAPV